MYTKKSNKLRKDVKDALFCFISVIIMTLLFLWMIYEPLPIVYWSTSQDKCVKIIVGEEECSCENLPEKYEKVWVK